MFSHVDAENKPAMVNVAEKAVTHRIATARSFMELPATVLAQLEDSGIKTKKGPVFDTAIIAGTLAVKKCPDLIPFCHAIPVEGCKINIIINKARQIEITCRVDTHGKTGVEMEALTGATVAALTIYDMCKALSHDIRILNTELVNKSGGKSDYQRS